MYKVLVFEIEIENPMIVKEHDQLKGKKPVMNSSKSVSEIISNNLNIILLFLFSAHFLGKEEYVLWIWGITGVILIIRKKEKILIDFHAILLIAILAVYSIMYKLHFGEIKLYTWRNMLEMFILPIFMYFLVRQMIFNRKENYIEKSLWAIVGGTFLYTILNYIIYLKEGFLDGARAWCDFWTHEPLYATQHSYWGIFIAALTGYTFCCMNQKKWLRSSISLIAIVVCNYINLTVQNRMVLMTTVVAIFISTLIYFIINWKRILENCGGILIFAVVLAVLLIIVKLNWHSFLETSYYADLMGVMSRDGGILHNIRFRMIIETLQQLPYHPYGGGNIHPAGFAGVHNYWLQAANDTGIVTLVLWGIYLLWMIVEAVWIVFQKQIEKSVKYMLIPLTGAVGSYLMMEIGGGGFVDYIIFFIILSAILHQMVQNMRKEY